MLLWPSLTLFGSVFISYSEAFYPFDCEDYGHGMGTHFDWCSWRISSPHCDDDYDSSSSSYIYPLSSTTSTTTTTERKTTRTPEATTQSVSKTVSTSPAKPTPTISTTSSTTTTSTTTTSTTTTSTTTTSSTTSSTSSADTSTARPSTEADVISTSTAEVNEETTKVVLPEVDSTTTTLVTTGSGAIEESTQISWMDASTNSTFTRHPIKKESVFSALKWIFIVMFWALVIWIVRAWYLEFTNLTDINASAFDRFRKATNKVLQEICFICRQPKLVYHVNGFQNGRQTVQTNAMYHPNNIVAVPFTHPRSVIQQPPEVNSSRHDKVIYYDETVSIQEGRQQLREASSVFGIPEDRLDSIFNGQPLPPQEDELNANLNEPFEDLGEYVPEMNNNNGDEVVVEAVASETLPKPICAKLPSQEQKEEPFDGHEKKMKSSGLARVKKFMGSLSPARSKKKKTANAQSSNENLGFKLSVSDSDEEKENIVKEPPHPLSKEDYKPLPSTDEDCFSESSHPKPNYEEREIAAKSEEVRFSRTDQLRISNKKFKSRATRTASPLATYSYNRINSDDNDVDSEHSSDELEESKPRTSEVVDTVEDKSGGKPDALLKTKSDPEYSQMSKHAAMLVRSAMPNSSKCGLSENELAVEKTRRLKEKMGEFLDPYSPGLQAKLLETCIQHNKMKEEAAKEEMSEVKSVESELEREISRARNSVSPLSAKIPPPKAPDTSEFQTGERKSTDADSKESITYAKPKIFIPPQSSAHLTNSLSEPKTEEVFKNKKEQMNNLFTKRPLLTRMTAPKTLTSFSQSAADSSSTPSNYVSTPMAPEPIKPPVKPIPKIEPKIDVSIVSDMLRDQQSRIGKGGGNLTPPESSGQVLFADIDQDEKPSFFSYGVAKATSDVVKDESDFVDKHDQESSLPIIVDEVALAEEIKKGPPSEEEIIAARPKFTTYALENAKRSVSASSSSSSTLSFFSEESSGTPSYLHSSSNSSNDSAISASFSSSSKTFSSESGDEFEGHGEAEFTSSDSQQSTQLLLLQEIKKKQKPLETIQEDATKDAIKEEREEEEELGAPAVKKIKAKSEANGNSKKTAASFKPKRTIKKPKFYGYSD